MFYKKNLLLLSEYVILNVQSKLRKEGYIMARPIQSGIDYFPLDVSFFNDSAVDELISTYGGEAPVVYLYYLTKIYSEEGYFFRLKPRHAEVTAKNLMMKRESVLTILDECSKVGLFDRSLYLAGILSSHRVQLTYQEAVKARSRRRDIEVEGCVWLLSLDETRPWIVVDGIRGTMDDRSKERTAKSNYEKKKKVTGTERAYASGELESFLVLDFDE